MDFWGLSHWYIDALIDYDNGDEVWRFTRFYGHPETNKREETWILLESLKHKNQIPWLCIGDFNEITISFEKVGGNIRRAGQMDRFHRGSYITVLSRIWALLGPHSRGQKITVKRGRLGLGWTKL